MPLSGDEIRIMSLKPLTGSESEISQINCSFEVVKLSEKPRYEALSYVWGDAKLPAAEVNDLSNGDTRSLQITRTLHVILVHLRPPPHAGDRKLWVDQLCINQDDLDEKSNQVRLMGNIYSGCQQCIFWLGDVSGKTQITHAENAFEFLRYMAKAMESRDADTSPLPSALESFSEFEAAIKVLKSLFPLQNVWWTRVWTLQEAILPRKAIVQLGSLSMSWHVVSRAGETWVQPAKHPKALTSLLNTPHVDGSWIWTVLNSLRANTLWINTATTIQQSIIMRAIMQWRSREASEPHDNVFALLGIFSADCFTLTRKCDYETTVAEVFCAFTVDAILHQGSLSPLCYDPRLAESLENNVVVSDLPRWAINMIQQPRKASYTNTHAYALEHWYKASAGRPLDVQLLRSRWAESHEYLALRGFMVDEVKSVQQGVSWNWSKDIDARPQDHRELRARLQVWAKAAGMDPHGRDAQNSSQKTYAGCDYTRHASFGRLMLGDLRFDDNQTPQSWANEQDIEAVWSFAGSTTSSFDKDYTVARDMLWMQMNNLFFTTRADRFGLGHWEAKPGDEVWILHGGTVPFLLRRRPGTTAAIGSVERDFVACCNVQGLMRGELFTGEEGENFSERIVHVY